MIIPFRILATISSQLSTRTYFTKSPKTNLTVAMMQINSVLDQYKRENARLKQMVDKQEQRILSLENALKPQARITTSFDVQTSPTTKHQSASETTHTRICHRGPDN
jgi:hypothetical protein